MNVQNVLDRKPSIVIAKIEMCWFMAINGKKSVEFDHRTNLIDGSHNGVKQSIAKAIDVMLCSEYENYEASLSCRHESKDPQNKRQSYVKMHLIGTFDFVLDGKQSDQFHISRYFNKKEVNFVFISAVEKAKQNKVLIQNFHHDLANVEMLRSLDPFISTDCMPNGSDINQLIVKMIGLKECATATKTMQNNYLIDSMQASELFEINKMFKERFAEVKDSMTKIRTLKCAFITQQIKKIKEKYPDVNELGKKRRLLANNIKQNKLNKKLNVFQYVQDYRCNEFNRRVLAERKAIEDLEKKNNNQQHIVRLDTAWHEYWNVYHTFIDQLKNRRADKLKHYEDQLASVEYYKVIVIRDAAKIADEMRKNDACIRKIADIEKINGEGKTDEQYEAQAIKGLRSIRTNIDAIQKIDDNSIGPAQMVFLYNRQKLGYYQQSMSHEIKMMIARAKVEEFYASDNWLHESQIQALQKGHDLLSANSNEFHEQFLGHVGQFIDVNTDFNILRVVLPILSKNYLSAFIFTRKSVADDFVKSFRATNPGKTILAFGKDEWDGDLEGDAPEGVSLDEKILAAETIQRYPFIKHFFRTFCITVGNKDNKYCQQVATNGIYKIFNGSMYYDETSMTCVKGANDIDYLKAVVEKWVEMGKNLHSQLDSGHQKCVANNLMDDSETHQIAYESELNNLRLDIIVHKKKIINVMDSHKQMFENGDKASLFRGECRVKAKVFHMKGEWLKNRTALESFEPIHSDLPPENVTEPFDAELALFDAIEKFSDFYIKGFSPIVYQSVEFLRLKEWISNCENFEPPHLRIEPEPNAIPDDYIEQCLKSNSELEAAYEKLLSLRNEQSLLSKHIDFCVLGSVEEYAQKDRADLRRELEQAQQNFPPDVILPGSDITAITDNFNLFDDDGNEDMRVVSAMTMENSLKASWHAKVKVKYYFENLLKILKSLNEFYDWKDQVFVFRLSTANGLKIEYIDHENAEMEKWIRTFTSQEICADDTLLNFYLKSNETGDYIINDDLDIKRHALVTLLHTFLSRAMNPSLFILNNTIVGRSSNEVADIIQKYRPNEDTNEAVAQLILFSRSNVGYRDLFDHHYKRMECRAGNNNRWNIIQTDQ